MKCNATVKFLFIGLYFAVFLLLLFGNPVDDSAIAHVVYYGFVIANLYNRRGVLFSSSSNNGANAGVSYSNTNNTASNTNANIGSQLCL